MDCSNLVTGLAKFNGEIEVHFETSTGLKKFDTGKIRSNVE